MKICSSCGSEIKEEIKIKSPDLILQKKNLIQSVVNVFETGTPLGNYGELNIFADGQGGKKQITYGKTQTTSEGHLWKLMEIYSKKGNGKYSQIFASVNWRGPSIVSDKKLHEMMIDAGKNDPVMKEAQDEFFDKVYWDKAYGWAVEENSFEWPLSMLVVYDSYIHSGSIPSFLRKRFSASPSNERAWITQYVDARHQWLKYWGDGQSQKSKLLRNTVYRTNCFREQIALNNWDLGKLPINANGIKVYA